MAFFRFPAILTHSPPMLALSDRASYLFIAGLAACSHHNTGGHLSWAQLRDLPRFTARAGAEVIQMGGWEETADGIYCPWFLEWNPLRTGSAHERDPRAFSADRSTKRRLIAKFGNVCAYCPTTGPGLHIEHIIPLSRGGADAMANLTLACARCNFSKGRKTAAEFGFPQLTGRYSDGPGASPSVSVLPEGLPDGRQRRRHVAARARRIHFPVVPLLAGAELTKRYWPVVESRGRAKGRDGAFVARHRSMLSSQPH